MNVSQENYDSVIESAKIAVARIDCLEQLVKLCILNPKLGAYEEHEYATRSTLYTETKYRALANHYRELIASLK